jgi:hypothetical protein
MLHLWLRAVLSCVLAAALPIQGVAATTMLHCGQDGQRAAHTHAGAHAQAFARPMASSSNHVRHHEMKSADAPRDAGRPIAAAKSGCSVCASCCIATALPAAIHAFEAKAPAESFAPVRALVAPVFLTGGPERPPRPLLA